MDHALESQFPAAIASREGSACSELDDVESLMRTHRARILRFVAFSINDQDAAESITQDCFLKAYRSRAQFRGECAVSTWLTRIAYRLICDHTRSERFKFWKAVGTSAVDVHDVACNLPIAGSSPESQVIARQQVAAALKLLEELPPMQRSVFTLRFLEEMRVEEIAVALGMPRSTVKTHLYRGLSRMREKMRTLIGERP